MTIDPRLAAAEAALRAGRGADAIIPLVELLREKREQPAKIYRVLLRQFYVAGRYDEGALWAALAAERFPRDLEVLTLHGVFLRRLQRHSEALAVFDRAIKLFPKDAALQINRGNVLLGMGQAAKAEAVFTQLVRGDPRNPETRRMLARSLYQQGKRDAAIARWRQATALKQDSVDAWLDLCGAYADQLQFEEAHQALDRGIQANPDAPQLHENKAILFRRAGMLRAAEAYLQGLRERFPNAAWLERNLGITVADYDRERANTYLRRAVELDPNGLESQISLIESLERTRSGDEGANIEEAYQLARRLLQQTLHFPAGPAKVMTEILVRVCAFDELERLGDFRTLGREWASSRRHTALLKQMRRVSSDEDRLELVEQHRIWGRDVERRAAAMPISRPMRPRGDKIRVGFMSSDLRGHPVAYFALPLFDHIDRERFEVFCYSYYQGEEDELQRYITRKVDGFRWWPDISAHDAAQKIADDGLDILLELGGSTFMNKLDVMAFRPATKQASWLGYPHSAGLEAIDYFICDPYSKPTRSELLIEQPLLMPKSWIALGLQVFTSQQVIEPGLPEDRAGHITFGTANNPHKYNHRTIRLWSAVLRAVPGSRFAFLRPEGGTPSFVKNLGDEFERNGVARDRLDFFPVRGTHMPFYNRIDITLDPAPLTGGTTTTESLWMGVPVVSLIGEAFYERLSYSILTNAGAPELATADEQDYVAIAAALAGDRAKRAELRASLRQRLTDGPLGQGEAFARDFYEMIARAVGR